MATRSRKAPARPEPPPQPIWRQPPAKPRGQRRRVPAEVPAWETKAGNRPRQPSRGPGRRPPWRKVLAVCCLAIAAGVFGQVWLNEGFRVQAAEVRGQVRVSAEDISRASAVAGRSIFQIRPTAVAGQISRVPGVAEATVHLRLPNQVIIDVIEHQPWIAWKVITDTVWLAADGLTTVPIAGQSPAFTLVDEAGAALDNAGRLKLYVFAGLKALHAARPELAEVYYGRAEGLFYRAPEGWTVYLGDTGKIASKLALLQAIQAEPALRSKRPVVIDLRSEGRAEIR